MLYLRVVLCFFLLATISVVAQQNSYTFPLNIKSGTYIDTVTGANAWAVGPTYTVRRVLACCDHLVYTFVRGAVWTSLTVTNPYSCDCSSCFCACPGSGGPPCSQGGGANWPIYPGNVVPFIARLTDISGTAVYDIPTRQNAPTNMPLRGTSLTIPQFVDSSMLTSSMTLNITFIPRPVNQIILTMSHLGTNFWRYSAYSGNTPPADWGRETYDTYFNPIGAQRSLGVRFRAETQNWCCGACVANVWLTRRAPVPPMSVIYYNSYTYSYTGVVRNTWLFPQPGWGDENRFQHSDGWTCYWSEVTSSPSSDPRWNIEFFEDVRLHRIVYTITNLNSMLSALMTSPDYSITVSPNSTHGMKLRFVWWNTTQSWYLAPSVADIRKTFGVQIIQPFALADLWVQIWDQTGLRLFTEVERHVPYVRNSGAGNVGYPHVINTMNGATSATLSVHYNRRVRISTFVEETKAKLLLRLVQDQGGEIGNITCPIPRTILPLGGVMGAVAAQSFPSGFVISRVAMRSALTDTILNRWYIDTIQFRFENRTSLRWRDWEIMWKNSTSQWYKNQVIATMMVATWARSSMDWSSNWWVFTDAFYPELPTMLPHFWDAQLRNRLIGFTEMDTRVAKDLVDWTYEHTLISSMWPQFAAEVPILRYQALRAYMIRTGHTVGPNMTFIPIVNMMRHTSSGAPNVQINHNWITNKYDFVLTSAVAQNAELFPDFGPTSYTKQEYLLRFGACPNSALDAATIPDFNGYLLNNDPSRAAVVNDYTVTFTETYKQSLLRLITVMSVKLGSLPIAVDGLGADPEVVDMATKILTAERAVLTAQITAGSNEYALLP